MDGSKPKPTSPQSTSPKSSSALSTSPKSTSPRAGASATQLSSSPPGKSIKGVGNTKTGKAKGGGPPAGFKKKPKLTKKERRELQEKQRAEKQKKNGSLGVNNKGVSLKQKSKEQMVKRTHTQKRFGLFSHLPQYERESSLSLNIGFSAADAHKIHPSILSLGLKYGENRISGANARAVSMLLSFKRVIEDYVVPEDAAFSRDLDKQLKPLIQFLIDCRPHCITMGNAIKHIRHEIAKIGPNVGESEGKSIILDKIDIFIRDRITAAQEAIIGIAEDKIVDGDCILTFSRSFVIEQLLLKCHDNGVKFKVVVVSARTRDAESKELLQTLSGAGIECIFVNLTAISYVMKKTTKVFLGASALFSNGTVLSRAGTAAVAMVANSFNKPVLFCAETYKFSERVQLDSITSNELGDPDELILPSSHHGSKTKRSVLSDWRDIPSMKLLNLIYDLTASEYVTMIITEVGMIPVTSVPVIVREQHEFDTQG